MRFRFTIHGVIRTIEPNHALQRYAILSFCCAVLLSDTSCACSRVYAIPYARGESVLLSRLKLDKRKLTNPSGRASAHVDGRLAQYMSMEDYGVELNAHEEGRHLRFTASNEYDIGGTGAQTVTFDLTKVDDERTRVSVGFSDRSLSLFIIPYWNPGFFRERRIAAEIFDAPPANNTK